MHEKIYLSFHLIVFIFDNWNDIIDYYVIGFYNFNACNEEFKNGIVPLSSDKPEVNSLVK